MRIRLDIPLMGWEVAKFTSGICDLDDISKKFTHITLDSRLAETGDLFIPIKGEKFNGNNYIESALSKGAAVISEKFTGNGIVVKSTDAALLKIANGYKSKLKNLKHTIAVTGSVGKSTTKEFIKKIASEKFKVHANEGNFNNTVGVPLTVLSAPYDTEILVAEAGMSHPGELSIISQYLEPDIAVITNIGCAHIANFGSRQGIAQAKKEIILDKTTSTVFVPKDEQLLEDIKIKKTVSLDNTESDICICVKSLNRDGSFAEILKSQSPLFDFYTEIPGRHILNCLSFAIAVCDHIGIEAALIKNGILSLTHESIRQRFIHFKNFSIYDDSYNSSPEALIAAFELLSLNKSSIKSALLGDMLELGRDTERLHFEAGVNAVKYGMRKLYLFGVYSPFILQGAMSAGMRREDIFINTDTTAIETTARQILENHARGEIILLKASHAVNLVRVCQYIKLLEG